MKPYVFISYKSEEFHYAKKIRDALKHAGVSYWMAPQSIKGGSSYAAEIPKAIKNCSAFLIVLTPKSQESQWVTRELDRAINENKIIIPFIPEKMTFKDDISFYLTNVQQYFAYEEQDSVLKHLIDDVCQQLHIKEHNDVREEPELITAEPSRKHTVNNAAAPESSMSKKKKRIIIWSIIAAVLLIASIPLSILMMYMSSSVEICGKRYLKGTTVLNLSEQVISKSSMDGISQLYKLHTLSLDTCRFDDDIKSLSQIPGKTLYSLSIVDCDIDSKMLNSLKLSENTLGTLKISSNKKIDNLSILTDCSESLSTLDISKTGINKLDDIAQCENLTVFSADSDGITDLSPLLTLKELRTVSVDNNKLRSLYGLDNAVYLESISARSNDIKNIKGLKNATLLKQVNLSHNSIKDASLLENSAENTTMIYISGNKLSDINFINSLSNLEYLDVSDNNISDISPIYIKSSVLGVDASHNQITEFDADLMSNDKKSIKYLDLSNNRLNSFKGTLKVSSNDYVCVNLENNNLSDASFKTKGSAYYLNLTGNPVGKWDTLYESSSFEQAVIVYNKKIDFSKMNKVIDRKLYLIDCPLSEQVRVSKMMDNKVEFLTSDEYTGSHSNYEYASIDNSTSVSIKQIIADVKGIPEN